MSSELTRKLLDGEPWDEAEREQVLECARRLERAARAGLVCRPLAGQHVAVVVRDDSRAGVAVFERAATALGAAVSYLPADQLELHAARVAASARTIELFYHALDATMLGEVQARRWQQLMKIPVFAGCEAPGSTLAALAAELGPLPAGPDAPGALDFVVQAALVQSCG